MSPDPSLLFLFFPNPYSCIASSPPIDSLLQTYKPPQLLHSSIPPPHLCTALIYPSYTHEGVETRSLLRATCVTATLPRAYRWTNATKYTKLFCIIIMCYLKLWYSLTLHLLQHSRWVNIIQLYFKHLLGIPDWSNVQCTCNQRSWVADKYFLLGAASFNASATTQHWFRNVDKTFIPRPSS